jgi:hypothetical protein
VDLVVDVVFTTRAVGAAVIERPIHVSFKILCQVIQAVYRIAEPAVVVASVAAVIRIAIGIAILGIASSPLRGCCGRQAESQDCRSEQ